MLDLLKVLIYGLIEGVTEWLPVSSTGHLLILERLLPLSFGEDFLSLFRIVIQLGAILAVLLLYWQKLWPWSACRGRKQVFFGMREDSVQLWLKIVLACLPAAVVGLLWDDWIEATFYRPWIVGLMLMLLGLAFLLVETVRKEQRISHVADAVSYRQAAWIGLFQLVAAVLPGTSRSGACIIGALLLGMSRAAAAEFTFLLGVPVMLGASLLKLLKFKGNCSFNEVILLLIATLTAFVVSVLVIRGLLAYIRRHNFKIFAYYRLALGLLILFLASWTDWL